MLFPVVSTRLSGIPELVEDGATGYLAEPGDVPSLVATLERCMDDADARARAAALARRRVTELHDLARTSAILAGVLRGDESK